MSWQARVQVGHALQLVSTAVLTRSIGWWVLIVVAVFVAVNLYAWCGARVKVVA